MGHVVRAWGSVRWGRWRDWIVSSIETGNNSGNYQNARSAGSVGGRAGRTVDRISVGRAQSALGRRGLTEEALSSLLI